MAKPAKRANFCENPVEAFHFSVTYPLRPPKRKVDARDLIWIQATKLDRFAYHQPFIRIYIPAITYPPPKLHTGEHFANPRRFDNSNCCISALRWSELIGQDWCVKHLPGLVRYDWTELLQWVLVKGEWRSKSTAFQLLRHRALVWEAYRTWWSLQRRRSHYIYEVIRAYCSPRRKRKYKNGSFIGNAKQ